MPSAQKRHSDKSTYTLEQQVFEVDTNNIFFVRHISWPANSRKKEECVKYTYFYYYYGHVVQLRQ